MRGDILISYFSLIPCSCGGSCGALPRPGHLFSGRIMHICPRHRLPRHRGHLRQLGRRKGRCVSGHKGRADHPLRLRGPGVGKLHQPLRDRLQNADASEGDQAALGLRTPFVKFVNKLCDDNIDFLLDFKIKKCKKWIEKLFYIDT